MLFSAIIRRSSGISKKTNHHYKTIGISSASFSKLNRKNISSTNMASLALLDLLFTDDASRIKLLSDMYQHSADLKFSIVGCGGAEALSWIFTTPGASACVVNANVPYSYESLSKYLDTSDEEKLSACNKSTAIALARKAYINAASMTLKKNSSFIDLQQLRILGVSCSASLATNRPKMGKHICFVGSYSSSRVDCTIVNFQKDIRTRQQEETLTAMTIIAALLSSCKMDSYELGKDEAAQGGGAASGTATATACTGTTSSASKKPIREFVRELRGVEMDPNIDAMRDPLGDDCIYSTSAELSTSDYLDGLFSGKDDMVVCVGANDSFKMYPNIELPPGTLVVPGSFNPLHDGHVQMAAAALKKSYGWEPSGGKVNPPVLFEISAVNVDKPPISKEDAVARLMHFQASNPIFKKYGLTNIAVVFTRMPMFIDKSKLFPNCNFLMGADTLERLLNPKYYAQDVDDETASFGASRGGGISPRGSFDVFARPEIDLRYINMASIFKIYQERGQKIIVGGRSDKASFKTGYSIIKESPASSYLTKSALSLFTCLSEEEFRLDLSSTDIRSAGGAKKP